MRMVTLLLAGLVLTIHTAHAADPVVLCQKGKHAKLRVGACKKKETAVGLTQPTSGDLSGIWKHRSGGGLVNGTFDSAFLVLNADGSGRLTERETTTQIVQCRTLRYAVSATSPSMSIQATGLATQVIQATRDGDVLTIIDSTGTGIYDRAGAVEAGSDCAALTEASRLTGLPSPSSSTGLVFTGSSFIYRPRIGTTPIAVSSTSGTLMAPPNLTGGSLVAPYAIEGTDIWGDCFCGAVDDAVRTNPTTGTLMDTVRTDTELGHKMFIRAIAVPSSGKLLLQGIASASNKGELLLANTAGEPDTLISAKAFPVALSSMAVDGTTAWGLLSGNPATIMKIDVDAGTSLGSFQLPLGLDWFGMTASGGKLFVLGNTPSNEGVIATFNQPG